MLKFCTKAKQQSQKSNLNRTTEGNRLKIPTLDNNKATDCQTSTSPLNQVYRISINSTTLNHTQRLLSNEIAEHNKESCRQRTAVEKVVHKITSKVGEQKVKKENIHGITSTLTALPIALGQALPFFATNFPTNDSKPIVGSSQAINFQKSGCTDASQVNDSFTADSIAASSICEWDTNEQTINPTDINASSALNTPSPIAVVILRNKQTLSTSNSFNALDARKQTHSKLMQYRKSLSESDLLNEIDNALVYSKGFLYSNGKLN